MNGTPKELLTIRRLIEVYEACVMGDDDELLYWKDVEELKRLLPEMSSEEEALMKSSKAEGSK